MQGDTQESLLKRADIRLYEAKYQGRNKVVTDQVGSYGIKEKPHASFEAWRFYVVQIGLQGQDHLTYDVVIDATR